MVKSCRTIGTSTKIPQKEGGEGKENEKEGRGERDERRDIENGVSEQETRTVGEKQKNSPTPKVPGGRCL